MAGQTVTVTADQRKNRNTNTSSGSSNSSGISNIPTYDKNKDYASEIQKAINSGASQDVINQLNAERNAKIKGENLNYRGLTDNDFSNYKNTGSFSGNVNSGGSYQNRNNNTTYNPSDEWIKNLQQSVKYDGNTGYADPKGYYTTRQTAYTWLQPDGTYKTTYSNATNYNQALQDAIEGEQVAPNSQLAYSSTYGTGSLTANAYNHGATSTGAGIFSAFGNGDDGGRYSSDSQYGNMYDQTNMQLGFLSGRDGMDYKNPYADIAYNGNGIQNAYNKGLQFAGQGELMGGSADPNNPTTPNLNDIYSQYGANTNGYVGLTKDDIQNQMDDIYANYEDAVAERNAALSSQYREQQRLLENDNKDQQRANYITYMLSLNNAPSQMQAMGINGGVAESTLAGLKSDYMSNYNSAENTFTNAVNQLKISEANALAEGNMEKANMYSQLAQNSLSLQMQAADAQNSYNKWLAEFNLTKEQWAYQKTQDEANRLASIQQAQDELTYKTAEWAYKIGDYDLLGATLGMDTSYLKQQRDLEAKYNQAKYEGQLLTNQGRKLTNSKKANGSSGGKSTSGNYSTTTAAGTVTTGGQTSSITPALDWVKNAFAQKPNNAGNSNSLTGYASGVYSDLSKSGYSPTQMDEAITREYNKGYITKAEADILASKLIG
nr:MAG TPA: hypothetical protein [Caudoviricetes sp.]